MILKLIIQLQELQLDQVRITSYNGTLTINAGATTGTITISDIVDDLLDEIDETIIISLSNPANATPGLIFHTVTIQDDDSPPDIDFDLISSSGTEANASKTITVNLSAISSKDVTVDYAVTGTATGTGTDYTL